MSRIVLHIDRLVLRGIEPGDTDAFSTALQAELQRQLAMTGMAETLRGIGQPARIKVGEVRSAKSGHEGLGQAVAQSIASGLYPGHAI
jgi:hypothetical protein